jgi:5-methylcytosine-specific restriction protein A
MPGGAFYRSKAWLAARAAVLKRDGYRCATPYCRNRATHVDHIRPIADGGAGLDPTNLQSLCASCHSRKTTRADGGFGNRRRPEPGGCDANGWPLDAAHMWRVKG